MSESKSANLVCQTLAINKFLKPDIYLDSQTWQLASRDRRKNNFFSLFKNELLLGLGLSTPQVKTCNGS